MKASHKIEREKKYLKNLYYFNSFFLMFFSMFLVRAFEVLSIQMWLVSYVLLILSMYVVLFYFKRAFWHLLIEGVYGLSFAFMCISANQIMISEHNMFVVSPSISWVIAFLIQLISGALYVSLIDIPAWKKDHYVNLEHKINTAKGSFSVSTPWYFSSAATNQQKTRIASFTGVGSALGILLASAYGVNFMWVVVFGGMAISGVLMWHRIFLGGLLVYLEHKHGKPIYLSMYR